MKKLVIVYVALIVVVILLFIVRGGGNLLSFIPSFGSRATADVNGHIINLLIAKSENDRVKGLSKRKSLPEDQGMLFIFDKKDRYGFWMKDVLFPLDIIYLDDNRVVHIVKNAPSSTQAPNLIIYRPDEPANHVLELNGGQADKLKIEEGTTVKFSGI